MKSHQRWSYYVELQQLILRKKSYNFYAIAPDLQIYNKLELDLQNGALDEY